MLTLEECQTEISKAKAAIDRLVQKLGEDGIEGIKIDEENADQAFLRREYVEVVYNLIDVADRIEYLSKSIIEQGSVFLNEQGRYEFPSGTYLTSGCLCEVLYDDSFYLEERWVVTSIEHNGEDYFATSLGREIPIGQLQFRIRG